MSRRDLARFGTRVALAALLAPAAACGGPSITGPAADGGLRGNSIATAWEARPTSISPDMRSVATGWEARATDPNTSRSVVPPAGLTVTDGRRHHGLRR